MAMGRGSGVAAGIAVAGGRGARAARASRRGAAAAPELPPVTPEDLVASVMNAPTPARSTARSSWTTRSGCPRCPDLPQAANGTSTARVWSGGDGKGRVALPTPDGERTLVSDGTTRWS